MKNLIEWLEEHKKAILILVAIFIIILIICKVNKNKRIAENIARENKERRIEEQAMQDMQMYDYMYDENAVVNDIPLY